MRLSRPTSQQQPPSASSATPSGTPPAPAPAVTPERPSPPAADATREREAAAIAIRGVIARYASALESRNMAQVRSVYPGMQRAEQNRWQALLSEKSLRDLQVQVTNVQAPDINGNTAEIGFTLTLVFADSEGPKRIPQSYRATLGRSGGNWQLSSIRQ